MTDQDFDALMDYLKARPQRVHDLAGLLSYFYRVHDGRVSSLPCIPFNLKNWNHPIVEAEDGQK